MNMGDKFTAIVSSAKAGKAKLKSLCFKKFNFIFFLIILKPNLYSNLYLL